VGARRGLGAFIGQGRERSSRQGKGRCWWWPAIMAMMAVVVSGGRGGGARWGDGRGSS
jgi:hypothetical protein